MSEEDQGIHEVQARWRLLLAVVRWCDDPAYMVSSAVANGSGSYNALAMDS